MSRAFYYIFPAIRGIQATREYYVSMCPLRLIPKIFIFDGDELDPELRAQRTLNKARIPSIVDYLVKNPTQYVFSALTASIDGDVEFVPASDDPAHYNVGHLKIPMTARFVINDGQHRRAAIEQALKHRPELGDETIACVFFVDLGLKNCQQMFADLNRYAVRPTQSLSILYDHRDPFAQMIRQLIEHVSVFAGMTEMERSTISNRSRKLFTLSGIYRATRELLADHTHLPLADQLRIATTFWNEVATHISDWKAAKAGHVTPAELRRDYVHAHTLALVALGRAGRALLAHYPHEWRRVLARLRDINWHRSNSSQWEGRATIGGKISISRNNVALVTNELKRILNLPLSNEEQAMESAFRATTA